MSWNFYLPIAEHSLNIFMLLGFGAAVGFLSGLIGVGGGFLMTLILIMAGIPPTIAATSDSNQIVEPEDGHFFLAMLKVNLLYVFSLEILLKYLSLAYFNRYPFAVCRRRDRQLQLF